MARLSNYLAFILTYIKGGEVKTQTFFVENEGDEEKMYKIACKQAKIISIQIGTSVSITRKDTVGLYVNGKLV